MNRENFLTTKRSEWSKRLRLLSQKMSGISGKGSTMFLYILLTGGVFFVWSSFQEVRGENIFVDSDQDGLSNEEERLYKTDPQKRDTDGDGYSDGVEVKSGYDPLKKAPGDKLFAVASTKKEGSAGSDSEENNLTLGLSQEIASVITEKSASGEDISLEDLDARVNELLSGKGSEVVLPPIDIKGLRIKNPISTKLSEKDRKEEEKKQSVKYLTAMAYIFANNAPQKFTNEEEMASSLSLLSGQLMSSLSGANKEMITTLADNGRETLKQAREVEIPDHMLALHIKALQLAEYAISLEAEIKSSDSDPMSGISDMMKIQSLLSASLGYVSEVEAKMKEYGIEDLPVQL